jgi:hypothetical protein
LGMQARAYFVIIRRVRHAQSAGERRFTTTGSKD